MTDQNDQEIAQSELMELTEMVASQTKRMSMILEALEISNERQKNLETRINDLEAAATDPSESLSGSTINRVLIDDYDDGSQIPTISEEDLTDDDFDVQDELESFNLDDFGGELIIDFQEVESDETDMDTAILEVDVLVIRPKKVIVEGD